MNHRDTMNTGRRSRNRRSAAVSAEDEPQRPRILADIRWNPRRPVRPTCCGWCSAHTAALREKSSCHARILQSCSTAGWSRDRTTWERHSCAGGFACSERDRAVPVPEGRRRRLAGGKSAPADAAPRKLGRMALCPSGASKKWSGMLAGHGLPNRPDATSSGGNDPVRPTPETSPMPRRGMPCSAGQPGAAPAAAGLPPANFLRCPSGTKRQASATSFRWSDGCHRDGPPSPRTNSSLPIPLPQIPLPTRPCSRAAPSRARTEETSSAPAPRLPLRLVRGGHSRAPRTAAARVGIGSKNSTAQNLIPKKPTPEKTRRRPIALPANCQGPL